jgi:shikimate dehydrogenase
MTSQAVAGGVFGIFGDPIGHSLSPVIHNAAFEALNLPYRYVPFHVTSGKLKEAVTAISALGIGGINVTIPHKETIIPFLTGLSDEARKVGAVNTVEVVEDTLIGHNTDGRGFLKSLSEAGVNPDGMRVILLGAGGAARGVAVSLLNANISELYIVARSMERRKVLHNDLCALFPNKKVLEPPFNKNNFSNAPTLLINATPLGMHLGDPLPYPLSRAYPNWVVADLVYNPRKTPFLIAAEAAGMKVVPGIGMLLHQAAFSFEIFTKQKAPIEAMRTAILAYFIKK